MRAIARVAGSYNMENTPFKSMGCAGKLRPLDPAQLNLS